MWFHPDFKSFFLCRYLCNSIVKKKPLEDTSSHKQPSLKVTHQSNKFDYFPMSISGDCVSAGHKGLFKRASLINTVSVRTVMLLSRCITTPWQGNSFSKVHATSVRRLCKICPICPTATQTGGSHEVISGVVPVRCLTRDLEQYESVSFFYALLISEYVRVCEV